MIVVATGPRSNGTSLTYRILCTATQGMPLHIPAFPPWLVGNDWRRDLPTALFVIVTRDTDAAATSLVRRNLQPTSAAAYDELIASLRYLKRLVSLRAHRLTYEELVADPAATIAGIDSFLRRHGYAGEPLHAPEPIPARSRNIDDGEAGQNLRRDRGAADPCAFRRATALPLGDLGVIQIRDRSCSPSRRPLLSGKHPDPFFSPAAGFSRGRRSPVKAAPS